MTLEKNIRENQRNIEDILEVDKNYYKSLTFHKKKLHKIKYKLRNKWKMTLKFHKSKALNIFIQNNRI
jgi:ABC-type Fe3+-citrate transport system substrate-binding protein